MQPPAWREWARLYDRKGPKPNSIKTRRITDRFYLCGDGVSDVEETMGLVAPRVMLCAAHQAQTVLRILAGEYEV